MSEALVSWGEDYFCAAHVGDDGELHGHTWKVRAYWRYDGVSIVQRKEVLRQICARLDHTTLPRSLSRAELIARHIAKHAFAFQVDVWREPEGMGGRWIE